MSLKNFTEGQPLLPDDVYDHLNGEGGEWRTFSPTFYQGTSNVSRTVNKARFAVFGSRTIVTDVDVTFTGTGTASSSVGMHVPAVYFQSRCAVADCLAIGSAMYYDASAGAIYRGAPFLLDWYADGKAQYVEIMWYGSTNYNTIGEVGFTAAVASGDRCRMFYVWESAADAVYS